MTLSDVLPAGADLNSFIADGVWNAGNGDRVPLLSPWDGSQRAVIVGGGAAGVTEAVRVAKQAFSGNESATLAARIGWIERAAAALEAMEGDIVAALVGDIGKPRRASTFEAKRTVAFMRAVAAEVQGLRGEMLPLDVSATGANRLGFVQRLPYGVVAAVTPFNAPANLLMQKVAPALVTGNAVIVKPAPEGTRVALIIAEAFRKAGLPAGLYGVVPGGAAEALALAADGGVSVVTITGGTAAGEALARAAGAKKFIGELGGNSPNIVLKDADLADAAQRIAASAFEASGQQCISAQRIIVEAAVHDEFLKAFAAAAAKLKVGDPNSPDVDLGPVVHARSADRIMASIERSIAAGAKLALGGERQGCMISPTILADAPLDAPIVCEEIFGPVAVVLKVADAAEALATANASEFGLQGAVFTHNLDDALKIAGGLRVGSVWINEGSRFRLDNYPFGGMGKSGHGREGVRYALEEYTQLKFTGIRLA